jgi:hypothetical protein
MNLKLLREEAAPAVLITLLRKGPDLVQVNLVLVDLVLVDLALVDLALVDPRPNLLLGLLLDHLWQIARS